MDQDYDAAGFEGVNYVRLYTDDSGILIVREGEQVLNPDAEFIHGLKRKAKDTNERFLNRVMNHVTKLELGE